MERFRVRGADGHRDEGVTLVELTIAMLIAGIVAAMVATTTIQAFRIQRDTTVRENDSTTASLAMDRLSRDLRQATAPQLADGSTVPAFSEATPQRVSLVSWVGDDPVKVTYALTGGTLTRAVQQPDAAGLGARSSFSGSGATVTATVARSVTSAALFTYVLSDDRVDGTFTTPADLKLVQSVRVDLTVDSDATNRLPGTTLRNTVVCLNL